MKPQPRRDEAAEFLNGLLSAGPVRAPEVMRRAREAGISTKTLNRAKANVGAISHQYSPGFEGRWVWRLR